MFFSTELLSRRDSGFGLLWLAATLGAKSSFKKLPKRSVLTADIAQLCNLIVEPSEPLALRLSSNLMVGLVRVYKVKQEILMSDVQTCFSALKKAVQDFQTMAMTSAAQLQMGQPNARPGALTLSIEPNASFALDFDNILANWDDIAFPRGEAMEDSDGGYGTGPRHKGAKQRRAKPRSVSLAEQGRADPHTLDENHEYLLSHSLDASFVGDGGAGPSSSQFGGGFGLGFDDNLFAGGDGMEIVGMDDLARELGWNAGGDRQSVQDEGDIPMDMGMDMGMDFQFGEAAPATLGGAGVPETPVTRDSRKRGLQDSDKENAAPFADASPAVFNQVPVEIEGCDYNEQMAAPPRKKARRVRLLLDARIELTDDELKAARTNYLEEQDVLRCEIERKKAEKESARMVEDMIWGAPQGLHAPALVDLWNENFRVQVEARTGVIRIHPGDDEPPAKRRKPRSPAELRMRRVPDDWNVELAMIDNHGVTGDFTVEEPELGRNLSRPASALESIGGRFGSRSLGTQRESFNWDIPAASSSAGGAGFFDLGDVMHADVRIGPRSGGGSRRSSVLPGPLGNEVGMSPAYADFEMPNTQMLADDFGFALPGTQSAADSQQSDANLAALERNSLDYAKMQLRSMPVAGLMFEEIVPKTICTAHAASSVFYHCLVLATKNLVAVEQPVAYGSIKLTKKENPANPA